MMSLSTLLSSLKPKALTLAALLLLQASSTKADIAGSIVVPMGEGDAGGLLPEIEISFIHESSGADSFFVIQSHGLDPLDDRYFKVEGPIDCIHPVSDDAVIISGIAMGTAMNDAIFFHVGDRILLAVADNGEAIADQASVIEKVANTDDFNACWAKQWGDLTMLDAISGDLDVFS